jgi:hypothetical protein
MSRFFAYSRDGFTFHATAEEAKAQAERLLDIERDFATREGEWNEDANGVMWGEVRQRAVERFVGQIQGDDWWVDITLEEPKK